MRAISGLLLVVFGVVLCAPAEARTVRGKVTKVVDGDTVRVKVGTRTRTFNLHGVKAPRGGACYSQQARNALRRMVNRKSVRVRIVRGRNAEIIVRGRNINRAMVAGGHARAKAGGGGLLARLRADEDRARERGRGLHSVCAPSPGGGGQPQTGGGPEAPPGQPQTGELTGQQAIAELTANLTGMGFRRASSSGGTTTNMELHLCPGSTFRFWSEESYSSGDGTFFNVRNESLGQWRVTEAQVKADGSRAAIVQGTVLSQATNDGPQPVTEPQASVRIDFAAGQWYVDGQAVLAFPGAANCSPRLQHG